MSIRAFCAKHIKGNHLQSKIKDSRSSGSPGFAYKMKRAILVEMVLVLLLAAGLVWRSSSGYINAQSSSTDSSDTDSSGADYIKWVDFNVSYEALCEAYAWDVDTHGTDHEVR